MNLKPILQFSLTAATAFLAGGGAMYSLPQSPQPTTQPIKAYPVSVTCDLKVPDKFYEAISKMCKHDLDVTVYGAWVKK